MRILGYLFVSLVSLHADPLYGQVIRLPVRIQLLHSSGDSAISTTYGEEQVRQLIAVANEVWHQAEIEWTIESVVRVNASRGAAFDSLVRGEIPRSRELLEKYFPEDGLLSTGWNVLLIRNFGQIAGGVFFANLGAVALAERGFGFELPAEGLGGRTLAHELGHSLGLTHVECDATRNIMANACWQPGFQSTLSLEQIEQARKQAKTGIPIRRWP
jgi:hypothetical protein